MIRFFTKATTVVLAALLMAVFLMPTPRAEAQMPVTNTWIPFNFGATGSTAGPFAFTTGQPTWFDVTDCCITGDQFQVLDNGVPLGTTSPSTQPGIQLGALTPDQACADGRLSSGSFRLPPGNHSLTIRVVTSAPGTGGGGANYRISTSATPLCSGGHVPTAAPLCIETARVQDDPRAQNLGIAAEYGGISNNEFFISAGGPTCKYHCIDGWDINCDGKIGDFCPIELNRTLVKNVAACLAAANPSTPAAAAPVAAAPPSTTLAVTGAETSVLGMVGTALLAAGAGATAFATRRRRNRDAD